MPSTAAKRVIKRAAVVVAVVLAVSALGLLANYEYQKKQEYAIYSVVFKTLLSKRQVKVVVLWDQTSINPIEDLTWTDLQARLGYADEHPRTYDNIPMIRGMEKTTDQVWANFKKRNANPIQIDVTRFSLPVPISAYTPDPSVRQTKDPWGDFYRKYPGSWGWTELSLVGFDRKAHQAVVYVGGYCGELCGGGYVFLLTKSQGEWKVIGESQCWVS